MESRFVCAVMFLWGAAGASSCGDFPDAPWVLRKEPRLLGFRVEVLKAGPNLAEGLLPIPADRIRSQPQPGDVVEISAFIASTAGETPSAAVDPVWMLCPVGPCLSVLNEPGARDACADGVPQRVPCFLPAGETTRFVAPSFDPSLTLEEQVGFRVALVGHTTDDVTTQECLSRMGDRSKPRWDGCLAGYFGVAYGPSTRVLKVALDAGVEVTDEDFDPEGVDFPVAPLFNPEIVPLLIVPAEEEDTQLTGAYDIFAAPDAVTVLEPGGAYRILEAIDPRDGQYLVSLGDEGIQQRLSVPIFSVAANLPPASLLRLPGVLRVSGGSARTAFGADSGGRGPCSEPDPGVLPIRSRARSRV